MAVSGLNFAAQVDDWCKASEARMTAVFRESTQRVASIAANGVPIDLGFARASVRASLEQMPQIDPAFDNKAKQAYELDLGNLLLTIAGAEIGQTIYVGWTAAYILSLEYGHSKQAPAGFVRIAAEQWQIIVNGVAQEAMARAA